MAGKLVTVATFDKPPQARLAQNALEAAGIKSTVADETTVAMDWLLGAAVGWVKVQVLEEDADRAVTVLEEALGTGAEPVDTAALAAEAEAAEPEEGSKPPPASPGDDAPEPPLSERDEYARRCFLAAVFSLVLGPLWFYAVYLFLNAAFGEGPISPQAKKKLAFCGVILVLCSATAYILFAILGTIIGSFP